MFFAKSKRWESVRTIAAWLYPRVKWFDDNTRDYRARCKWIASDHYSIGETQTTLPSQTLPHLQPKPNEVLWLLKWISTTGHD